MLQAEAMAHAKTLTWSGIMGSRNKSSGVETLKEERWQQVKAEVDEGQAPYPL